MVETKSIYEESEKTMKAFYKKNDEKYTSGKYAQTAPLTRARKNLSGTKDQFLAFATEKANLLKAELEKHSAMSVHHDSGKTWKKTATDKKRFEKMNASVEAILKIVS